MKNNIAVIGGGASGIVAAIAAARHGASVTVLEKEQRIAKKIPATGNGRCNLTNIYAELSRYHGGTQIMPAVMKRFWVNETLDFFSELGLITKTEPDGKVYPYCSRATAVSETLRFELARLGVQIITDFAVSDIRRKNGGFEIISRSGDKIKASRVILAAGGKASPKLGSDGSGFDIAARLGHTVTPLSPSLVQLKTSKSIVRSVKGLKAEVRITSERGAVDEYGELLFNDYSLSGPAVFAASSRVTAGDTLIVDLMPDYTAAEVLTLLLRARSAYKTLDNYLVGILDKRIGMAVIKECGIAPFSKLASEVTDAEAQTIAEHIKAWRFPVTGTMSWNNAQVTKGGVDTSEVDAETLRSKLVPHLYLCGEILDIDGDCGGFNLQWAWSSGYIAGKTAALET